MKAPRRNRKKEKVRVRKEIHERWLLTYSDLITLLLAFFIIMYSVASVNQGKFQQLAQSLHLAFSGSTTPIQFASASGGKSVLQPAALLHQAPAPSVAHAPNGKSVLQQVLLTPQQAGQVHGILHEDKVFSSLYARLQTYIRVHNLNASVTAVNGSRGIQIEIHADILFDTGSDRLRQAAQRILLGLVPFLDAVQNRVQVNGYTDSAGIQQVSSGCQQRLRAGDACKSACGYRDSAFLGLTGFGIWRTSGGPYHFEAIGSGKAVVTAIYPKTLARKLTIVYNKNY